MYFRVFLEFPFVCFWCEYARTLFIHPLVQQFCSPCFFFFCPVDRIRYEDEAKFSRKRTHHTSAVWMDGVREGGEVGDNGRGETTVDEL